VKVLDLTDSPAKKARVITGFFGILGIVLDDRRYIHGVGGSAAGSVMHDGKNGLDGTNLNDVNSSVIDAGSAHNDRLRAAKRLRALNDSGLMDSETDPAHERVIRIASRMLQAPTAAVSYVDDQRQFFKAQCGMPPDIEAARGTPLSHSFCQYVVSSDAPLIVRDSREVPELEDNGAIEDLDVIAYIGVPIHWPDGEVLGSLCAIDSQPRDWSESDLETLRDLVGILESELALLHAVNDRDTLLQEMNHRIKNLFSLINGLVRMERRNFESAEDLAASISTRIASLAIAHEMIVPVVAADAADAQHMDMRSILDRLLAPYANLSVIRLTGEPIPVGPKSVVYFTLAIHELATNAAKYGALSSEEGVLSLSWRADGGRLVFDWEETGLEWHETGQAGTGFGSRLLDITVKGQLGGAIITEVRPDRFAHRITLPLDRLDT
jgi:two-component sensor histidine kinase